MLMWNDASELALWVALWMVGGLVLNFAVDGGGDIGDGCFSFVHVRSVNVDNGSW